MITCQLVVHCRLQTDMGILQKPEFDAIVARKSMQLPFLPSLGSEAVLLRSGYEAHKARQRPPAQNAPADLPKAWAAAEKCRIEEVSPLGVLLSSVASPLWKRTKGCRRQKAPAQGLGSGTLVPRRGGDPCQHSCFAALSAREVYWTLQAEGMTGTFTQVAYARGHWQRPVWQGRFAGMPPPGSEDDSLLIVWLLLERRPPQNQSSQDSEASSTGALGSCTLCIICACLFLSLLSGFERLPEHQQSLHALQHHRSLQSAGLHGTVAEATLKQWEEC